MTITEFIQTQVFLPRLQQKGCLVVYDPQCRYRDICLGLASEVTTVVDSTESGIASREAAIKGLLALGVANTKMTGMLVYVPAERPMTDQEKQHDPFSLYSACGLTFPDGAGDEFEQICLRAKPDQATEIRRVFAENPNPSFSVIDAIGGGMNWPHLRAILNVESANDILFSLLFPSSEQEGKLKSDVTWVQEGREFFKVTLGLSLKTRAKALSSITDELWRFVLFSEFVFDLPEELPASLTSVPHASTEAQSLVEYICDRLRNDIRTQTRYIERAERIEEELNLPAACAVIDNLGVRDTFPFEERSFLQQTVRAFSQDDLDRVRNIVSRRKNSVWLGKGESQSQWGLVEAALVLVEACDDYERQLGDHARTLPELLDFYTGSLREVDRVQREFEQAVSAFLDRDGLLSGVMQHARNCYRNVAEKMQSVFTKHLQAQGWPPSGRLANAGVFDRFIGPRLKERGHKIAYLMVDALRYELGVALEKRLSEDGPVELHAAYAQFPTVTLAGMASLLPGAASELTFSLEGENFAPKLNGVPVGNVAQRMGVFRNRLGDRFFEMRLDEFVRTKKVTVPNTVELLVLRSVEIDDYLETNPENTLKLIPDILSRIRAALHKLRGLGFQEAVIATDHGFYLNAQAEAGDVCLKPQGVWPVSSYRSMLGKGGSDSHNLVMQCEKVGIRGDFNDFATPGTMAPYRDGLLYFHGGASLQEAVVPVLVAKIGGPAAQHSLQKFKVELMYKNGAKKITTRRPVIELLLSNAQQTVFSSSMDLEIILEAQDPKGNVVGEAKPGGIVNPATRTILLNAAKREAVTLCMLDDYEGKFTVVVLDPKTLSSYCEIKLETDYAV